MALLLWPVSLLQLSFAPLAQISSYATANKDSACRIICMLCQQISPKLWFANVNMTLYYDVINSVYPVKMTTIRHCSILGFGGGHTIKQSPRVSPDLCTPLVSRTQRQQTASKWKSKIHRELFKSQLGRLAFTSPDPSSGSWNLAAMSGLELRVLTSKSTISTLATLLIDQIFPRPCWASSSCQSVWKHNREGASYQALRHFCDFKTSTDKLIIW